MEIAQILPTIVIAEFGALFLITLFSLAGHIKVLDRYRNKYGFDRTLELGNTKQQDKAQRLFQKRLAKLATKENDKP